MLAELCVSSGRVWVGIFVIYMFAMLYGIIAMVGNPHIALKSADHVSPAVHGSSDDTGLIYEDDLLKSSAFKDGMSGSTTNLRNLPIDFPLAHGLAKPVPVIRAGSVRRNATIAIGIPSVKREGTDYLVPTTESLLRHLTEEQKKDTIIVIFLGETDTDYLDKRVLDLQSRFGDEMSDGMIEIIAPPRTLYPDWSKTVRSSFGDTMERSIWRSKQNLDQVFLMMYIYHLRARYYLMMEDDVIATSEYMTKLMKVPYSFTACLIAHAIYYECVFLTRVNFVDFESETVSALLPNQLQTDSRILYKLLYSIQCIPVLFVPYQTFFRP